jgi:hypothetical protein
VDSTRFFLCIYDNKTVPSEPKNDEESSSSEDSETMEEASKEAI